MPTPRLLVKIGRSDTLTEMQGFSVAGVCDSGSGFTEAGYSLPCLRGFPRACPSPEFSLLT